MKKLSRFLLIITLLFIFNCVGKKIHLDLNLKQGESFKSRVTAEQKISQTIQQQEINMEQTVIMEYTYDVMEVNETGNMKIKITYNEIGFIQDGPLGKTEYKSWEAPDDIPLMAMGFASLVGQSVTVELSQQGRVIQVSGVGKILDNMMQDRDLPADTEMRRQIQENLKNQFGDEAMKETMEKMFAIYPENPVGVGESWNSTLTITKGFPMVFNNTWKVKSIKDGKVYVDVHSKVEPNAEASLMQIGGMEMSYELSGQQKGHIIIDTITGWVTESKVEQNLEGNISKYGVGS